MTQPSQISFCQDYHSQRISIKYTYKKCRCGGYFIQQNKSLYFGKCEAADDQRQNYRRAKQIQYHSAENIAFAFARFFVPRQFKSFHNDRKRIRDIVTAILRQKNRVYAGKYNAQAVYSKKEQGVQNKILTPFSSKHFLMNSFITLAPNLQLLRPIRPLCCVLFRRFQNSLS